MKRLLAFLYLLPGLAWAQPANINPNSGDIWTFYGPTLGAGWGSPTVNAMAPNASNAILPDARTALRAYPRADPRDYGAVCDGSARQLSTIYGSLAAAQVVYPAVTALTQELDWAATQKALNATPHSLLVYGTCVLGEPLSVPSGTTVTGHSKQDGFKASASFPTRAPDDTSVVTTDPLINIAANAVDVNIHGLKLDGNSRALYGILSTGTSGKRISIDNNYITGVIADGVRMTEGSDFHITRNTVDTSGKHGITISLAGYDFSVVGNTINNPGGAGIIFMVGKRGSIIGNTIVDGGPDGDAITGYRDTNEDVVVANNIIIGSANHGIHVGGQRISVTGNVITGATNTGIFMYAEASGGAAAVSGQCVVSGNAVSTSDFGYTIRDGDDCVVKGNSALSNTSAGFRLDRINRNVLSGNLSKLNGARGFLINGGSYNILNGNLSYDNVTEGYYCGVNGAIECTFNTFSGNVSRSDSVGFKEADAADNNVFIMNRVLTPDGNSYAKVGASTLMNNIPLVGSATYDPANLADGAGVTTTVTVTGAAVGDTVDGSFDQPLNGVVVTYFVSSGSTVSIRFQNQTGVAVDLASGTLRAWVTRR